ncbi:MAG: CRISPR-associated endonuclease Cas1 [Oscillochloridaceae bacterium umkhey_bin13]
MPTLYVQEQGVTVGKRAEQVIITKNGQLLESLPLNKIDQVVVMGRGVQLSTALLVDLIGRGIPVLLTNQHGSRHYATLSAGPSRYAALRLAQAQRIANEAWAMGFAKALVRAKLTNQRNRLIATGWPAALAASAQIAAAAVAVDQATTLDMVRGYEGAGAAAYFGAWRATYQASWGFQGREFYPPPDPLNALLSFGYTLLLNDVISAVQLTGLDPYMGVFHVIEAGRPSLALDLMEEFRPLVIDRLVLEWLQEGSLKREQFERPAQRPEAIYLNAQGRALVVARYEAMMAAPTRLASGEQTALRRAVLLQVQAVARVIRREQANYQGYTP